MKEITKLLINSETKNGLTLKVTLKHPRKDENGRIYIQGQAQRFILQVKRPQYLVQVFDANGRIAHVNGVTEWLTDSIERYTKFSLALANYVAQLKWREENPCAPYSTWPIAFLDGFKGHGGDWKKFPEF